MLFRSEVEFRDSSNIKIARKKFTEFTKNVWVQDITDDEIGSNINYRLSKVLELDRLYYEIKTKYDVLYKELNIEKNYKANIVVAIILVLSLILNILNYIELMSH